MYYLHNLVKVIELISKKQSTFIVFENADNLDMYRCFNMDLIGLTEAIKGKYATYFKR